MPPENRRSGIGSLAAAGNGVAVILRTPGVRIIGIDDDQSALHPGIGNRKQWIGGYIEPHMFHGCKGARHRNRRTHGNLKGHLLVGGPLGFDIPVIPCHGLHDLRTGGSRIGCGYAASSLPGAQGYRLIGEQKLFFNEESLYDQIYHLNNGITFRGKNVLRGLDIFKPEDHDALVLVLSRKGVHIFDVHPPF